MSFSRAFQWYHSHLDPIWPDGTFKLLLHSLHYTGRWKKIYSIFPVKFRKIKLNNASYNIITISTLDYFILSQFTSKPVAQVVEKKVGYPKFVSSKLWSCSFDRESFNAWRNNTRYLPTLATIITIWKIRIASLDLRSWQNPIWKYALLRGNRVCS